MNSLKCKSIINIDKARKVSLEKIERNSLIYKTTINVDKIRKVSLEKNEKSSLTNREITDHTAKLWKCIPIKTSDPEPFPEEAYDLIKTETVEIIAARVRGKKHKHEGVNCDDYYHVEHFDGLTVIAVSDGAGSKKYSRIGAKASCLAVTGFIKENIGKAVQNGVFTQESLGLSMTDPEFMGGCGVLANIVQEGIINAYDDVENAFIDRKTKEEYACCLDRELEFKDFSATLLVSVAIPVGGEYFLISCQIGDGMIAVVDHNEEYTNALKLLGEADTGGFLGETDFLTSQKMRSKETLMSRTKITRGKTSTLMMMTDGVADDYYPNDPGLLRLYMDLLVNRVIGCDIDNSKETTADNAENETEQRLGYVKELLDVTCLNENELWNRKELLETFRDNNVNFFQGMAKDEILKVWLDNYVERGSFDDRTIVLLNVCGG